MALSKANELVAFYAGFLPPDYFKPQNGANNTKNSVSNFSR